MTVHKIDICVHHKPLTMHEFLAADVRGAVHDACPPHSSAGIVANMTASTVAQYLAALPVDRRAALSTVREAIITKRRGRSWARETPNSEILREQGGFASGAAAQRRALRRRRNQRNDPGDRLQRNEEVLMLSKPSLRGAAAKYQIACSRILSEFRCDPSPAPISEF